MTKSEKPTGKTPKSPPTVKPRVYPQLDVQQLADANRGLGQAMVWANNHIRALQDPAMVAAMGISEENLSLFLAHMVITYRTLRELAYFVQEDLQTARSTETLLATTGPVLLGPDGQPIKH